MARRRDSMAAMPSPRPTLVLEVLTPCAELGDRYVVHPNQKILVGRTRVSDLVFDHHTVTQRHAKLHVRAEARLVRPGKRSGATPERNVPLPPKGSIGDWFYLDVEELERAAAPDKARIDEVGAKLASSVEAHIIASLEKRLEKDARSPFESPCTSGLPSYLDRYLARCRPSKPLADRLEIAIAVMSELLHAGYRFAHKVDECEWEDATVYFQVFHRLAGRVGPVSGNVAAPPAQAASRSTRWSGRRARRGLDLETLRFGEPAHAELRAAHVGIVDRARGVPEGGIVTPQREPAERHRAGHGQRPDAIDVAGVEQPQPRRPLLAGALAQPAGPAVVAYGIPRLRVHVNGPTGAMITLARRPAHGPRVAPAEHEIMAKRSCGPVSPVSRKPADGGVICPWKLNMPGCAAS
jgi:hypothetical protein